MCNRAQTQVLTRKKRPAAVRFTVPLWSCPSSSRGVAYGVNCITICPCAQTASSLPPRRTDDGARQAADPTLTKRLRELYASAPAPDAKQAGGGSLAVQQLLEVRGLCAGFRAIDGSATNPEYNLHICCDVAFASS